MAKNGAGALGLRRAVFFACLIGHIVADTVPDLQCHTDYDMEVFCHWEVTETTDCAREFRLRVSGRNVPTWECALQNRRMPESASPSCVCVIRRKIPSFPLYTFLLVTRANQSKEKTLDLSHYVQPRPLRNLTVTKNKAQAFILAWKKSYAPSIVLHSQEAFYQIQISAEGQKKPDLRNLSEQTEQYEIFADQLLPRKNYSARIRYAFPKWKTFWSDWSRPCWWFNDFEPERGDQLWWFVLLVCFLVMLLVSACYFCFARLKRQWWDQIPSPKIADDLGKKPGPVPWQVLAGEEGKVPLCATSEDLFKRQLSDKEAQMDPGGRLEENWEGILTPETPSLESSLAVCSPIADPDPGTQAEAEEDHQAPSDNALAKLFLDILGGGSSAEDTGPPEPAWAAPPPAGAPEPARGECRLHGGLPGNRLEGSSDSGYRNCVASSSRAASQGQGDGQSFSSSQYKSLLLPQPLSSSSCRAVVTDRLGSQADGQGDGSATTPPPSGYRSFSSLTGQPTASCHQPQEPPWDSSGVDHAQLLGGWPPCQEEGLFLPPLPGAPSGKAADCPRTMDPCLPGYRPLRSACQDPSSLSLGSPYKPLLEAFRSVPRGDPLEPTPRTQEAERQAWGAPLAWAFSREGEGVRQETERFLPHVPPATL